MTSIEKIITITVGLLVLISIVTIVPMIGDRIDNTASVEEPVAATGTLTFTANASDAETVNITAGGTTYTFEYDTNLTASEITAGNIEVDIGNETPAVATANLTTAINANVSVAAYVDATNPTTTTVLLTADAVGTSGNSIGTTETIANASFSSATLTGGLDGSQWSSQVNTDIVEGYDIWGDTGAMISLAAVVIVVGVVIVGLIRFKAGY